MLYSWSLLVHFLWLEFHGWNDLHLRVCNGETTLADRIFFVCTFFTNFLKPLDSDNLYIPNSSYTSQSNTSYCSKLSQRLNMIIMTDFQLYYIVLAEKLDASLTKFYLAEHGHLISMHPHAFPACQTRPSGEAPNPLMLIHKVHIPQHSTPLLPSILSSCLAFVIPTPQECVLMSYHCTASYRASVCLQALV